jgi:hypothetical protein
MKDVGNGVFEVSHELQKPRISQVCKVKLLLVSAACCFQSMTEPLDNDDDLEDEEEDEVVICSVFVVVFVTLRRPNRRKLCLGPRVRIPIPMTSKVVSNSVSTVSCHSCAGSRLSRR